MHELARVLAEPVPRVDLELFYNGTLINNYVYDYDVTLVASSEPITLEMRPGQWIKDERGAPAFRGLAAGEWDAAAPEISMDVDLRGGLYDHLADPAPPALVDHGNGTASLTVDRSVPADRRIRIAAGDAHETFSILVIPRLPAGHGNHDGLANPPPRIAAQARLPLCADVAHAARVLDPAPHEDGLGNLPRGKHISGVPPIEGTVHQEGEYEVPVGEPETWWDWPGWDCSTWASYGTQAPQLLRLCEIPGHDRIHHYARHEYGSAQASETSMFSPYTGYMTTLTARPAHTYAAAPGPYWEYLSSGGVAVPYPPDVDVPPVALYPIREDGTAAEHLTRVTGTYSSVPELLPFDGLVAIRATAFHADGVTFEVSPGAGLGLPRDGAVARVNGTSVPVEVVEAGGWLDPAVKVRVSVSEIAWASGILVRGITDARATAGSVVRDLHEVTLVAEIPVDTRGGSGYVRLDPSQSVEPWGCWPREGGAPMRVGSREAWPAGQREGSRMLPAGPAREHVEMGEAPGRRMEAAASAEPVVVGVRAPEGWGEGTVISARVTSSWPWQAPTGAAAPGIDVANRGDGTAVVGIERLDPGEHEIEITASGPAGSATEAHTLRIVPPRAEGEAPNLEPELAVLLGGEPAEPSIDVAASPKPAALELRAVDPEGDRVRFAVDVAESSYGARAASMVRLDDRGDGTAALLVDRSESGELVLDVFAADARGEDMATHLVRVLPAPGSGVFLDGLRVGPPLVELRASGGEALLEARSGDGGEASVRALRSSHWGAGGAPGPPRVGALAGGAVAIWVDASAPGEHLVEVDAGGAATAYVIRVLPAAAGAGR